MLTQNRTDVTLSRFCASLLACHADYPKAANELVALRATDPGNLKIALSLGDCYFRLTDISANVVKRLLA